MMSKRFYGAALMAAMCGIPALAACSSTDNPLCCTEFKVGATLDASIGGSAQSQVAAQAVADIGGIASAAVDDLTAACRGIAQDMSAAQADQDAAEANADKGKKMQAWCALAVAQIKVQTSAGITIKVVAVPPVCEASISAKADCQAKCSGSAKCDIKANPPTCTGGKLVVDCKGSCTAEGGGAVSCEGSCQGECQGGCKVEGGIKCAGKCEGTCEGAGGAGTSGVDAQGNCQGTCKGTCSATPPGVQCTGSCSGSCKGSCKASASASVKCDGKCDVDAQPISCTGGKLEGGCKVEAKCDANCDASVSAKADCKPPQLSIQISGGADLTALGKLQASLEANLPLIFGIKAKLDLIAQATTSFTGNISAVADIKVACIPIMVKAAGDAIDQVTISAKATVDVTASVGGG